MANIMEVGNGKVYMIAGGGKCYSAIAAKFCRSEKGVEEIIGSEESLAALKVIIESGHQAALEFDDFIFGVEGYSRVTEVQLVRKRHASYNIKSGRIDKHGKRSFDVALPKSLSDKENPIGAAVKIDPNKILVPYARLEGFNKTSGTQQLKLSVILDQYARANASVIDKSCITATVDQFFLIDAIESWYNHGVTLGYKEEDLRYLKPQATEFKACIKMNLSGLLDWFKVRMCNRAQEEIRDLATKIYQICVQEFPVVFKDAGANCKCLGYCPEKEQCSQMKGKIPTKEEAMKILKHYYNAK